MSESMGYLAKLRRVGGSVMVSIPPAILHMVGLEASSTVAVSVEGTRVVLRPARKRYTLEQLLADFDPATMIDYEFDRAPAVGGELI